MQAFQKTCGEIGLAGRSNWLSCWWLLLRTLFTRKRTAGLHGVFTIQSELWPIGIKYSVWRNADVLFWRLGGLAGVNKLSIGRTPPHKTRKIIQLTPLLLVMMHLNKFMSSDRNSWTPWTKMSNVYLKQKVILNFFYQHSYLKTDIFVDPNIIAFIISWRWRHPNPFLLANSCNIQ